MLVAQKIFLFQKSNIQLADHQVKTSLNPDVQVSLANFYTVSSGTYGTLK